MDKETSPTSQTSQYTPLDELTVTECFERLKLVSQKGTYKDVSLWLGKKPNDYANRKRSNRIPFAEIIRKLLQERISLNWFFAPGYTLHEPTYSYTQPDYVKSSVAEEERKRRLEFLKAHRKIEPFLKAYNLESDEQCLEVMLDVYFSTKDKWMEKSQALELVAKALSLTPASKRD
ncbi:MULTISPECIES: hypothetical protein [Idiomarina]|jgi:hypothetical protein|uniref:hypothetical protein n=1 Tax=Idiomarina TaxID=135575 RepID=UPI000C6268BC|nr:MULTISPECIES: hypothetical protein [Idiomarina]MAO67646.1 hypothetical protein [Idiomarina sp.]MBF79480.1 hypothetical protein [Idiomarina sp.]|tara:strand:- start:6779 stop:7306 length:528 start_codon:yes stop_codon:yes gene_type:complete